MPENEFEKKVSSELQQLKFKPSDTVWMKVEERIRRKKKRRVFFIIFLLAGIALLAYWQWDNLFGENGQVVKTETPAEEIINKANQTDPDIKQKDSIKNETRIIKGETEKDDTGKNETANEKSTDHQKEKQIGEQLRPKQIIVAGKIQGKSRKRVIKNDKSGQPAQKRKVGLTENDITLLKENAPVNKEEPVKINSSDSNIVKQEPNSIIKTDSINLDSVTNSEKIKNDTIVERPNTVSKAPADSPVVKLANKVFDKKWKWSAHFTPGISFLNQNGFIVNENKSADALNYQSPSQGSGSAAGRQKPSDIKPGFAFQLGVSAQRKLSERTNISVGLQYAFYSHRLGVGLRRDSLQRFLSMSDANAIYNAGGDTLRYTNRYHFIEMPFRFGWQLNKSETWPITWSNGISFGYLFATNAIFYDTAYNGIYHQNKKWINKTQFSFSTSLSFTIANNRRMQWQLGPFADFHLNRLIKSPFEKKEYLFFTGVRTSVIFNSKK